jgi:hypothetical protein
MEAVIMVVTGKFAGAVLRVQLLENTMLRKLDLFPSSGEEGDTYSVWSLRSQPQSFLVPAKGSNRIGISPLT